MKQLLTLFFMFLFSFSTFAEVPQVDIENAYNSGEYEVTLDHLLRLEVQHPQHFDLLYNIGNTYFKLGELGEAITYYYRASRLNPRDKDLIENMSISQDRVVDDVESRVFLVEVFKQMMTRLSINEWFYLFLSFFLLSIGGAFLRRRVFFTGRFKLLHSAGVSISVVLLAVTALHWTFEYDGVSAVIVERKVEAKSGPSDSLKTQFFVHEGVRISVIKVVNGWAEIHLNNGFQAWVKEASYWDI